MTNHTCSASSAEYTSYNQMSLNCRIDLLGKLVTAIAIITDPEYSQECEQLQQDTDELKSLQGILPVILAGNPEALAYDGSDIVQFIKQHENDLKNLCIKLYSQALQDIVKEKKLSGEHESLLEQHPINIYAQFLNSFSETQFFPIPDEMVDLVTQGFNFCCQKIYNECLAIEEHITKKTITSIVDCMWYIGLLGKNKDQIMYVLGGWRFSRIMVALEELREQYADQPLTDLDDQEMLKLMEALAAQEEATSSCSESCCCDEDDDDEEEDDECCCCNDDCCSSHRN
ncbi:MAG TPA: hypothetical protein PKD74_00375 [Candidatus Dependentiae bacterium]|nr:hypothetical protein [Candidatus Dependentiae bacterium]